MSELLNGVMSEEKRLQAYQAKFYLKQTGDNGQMAGLPHIPDVLLGEKKKE